MASALAAPARTHARTRYHAPLVSIPPPSPCRVGNAKQAAGWFVARFGFTPIAYRGLETGSRTVCTHVLGMNGVRFALSSQLNPGTTVVAGDDMSAHLVTHGDGVKDIAFAVADCRKVFDAAVARGAAVVAEPHTLSDEHGSVTLATIRTYGDTVHTFVQRGEYAGAFLPGFRAVTSTDPLVHITPSVGLERIDHIVGNMPDKGMLPTVEWYERVLQFHRFWSVDDSQIHTEYSGAWPRECHDAGMTQTYIGASCSHAS